MRRRFRDDLCLGRVLYCSVYESEEYTGLVFLPLLVSFQSVEFVSHADTRRRIENSPDINSEKGETGNQTEGCFKFIFQWEIRDGFSICLRSVSVFTSSIYKSCLLDNLTGVRFISRRYSLPEIILI